MAYKYTGKEWDDSTGLYFYEARYYDATLGRFISADTLVPNPGNPQDFNRYTYGNNNPILFNDPTGRVGINSIKNVFKKATRKLKNTLGSPGFTALSFGIQVGIVPVPFLSPIQSGILGTGLLTQSKSGRYVLAGEIIVGTAVASWQCGGCVAAPVINGALLGEVTMGTTGGLSAAANGQDISRGFLIGTIIGGASGALSGHLSPNSGQVASLAFGEKFSIGLQAGFVQGVGEELTRQLGGSGMDFGKLQLLKVGLTGLQGGIWRGARVGAAESLFGNSQWTTIVTKAEYEIDGESFSRISIRMTANYADNFRALAEMVQPTSDPGIGSLINYGTTIAPDLNRFLKR